MAGKVLSMEIGQATTRVIEIDYMSKNPKIYQAFSLETPKDMVQDGVIARNEDFIINLKSELRRREIKTENVVFTVSSSRIANREARIPLCSENKILPLITANASEYFPVDMNQYHLVYNILGKIDTKEEKQYRLSLLAVPNDVTTSYLDLAHSLGMHIRAIDYVGNSVFQVVRQDFATGTNAVIKIDEYSSLVTIVKDGEIVLQRSVAHGVNAVIENMMELDVYGENLDYYSAIKAFTTNHCIRRYLNVDVDYQEPEDTTDEIMMSRIMLTENLRYLIGNVGRILEYYVSRNDNEAIENIELVGIGADFVGLNELLSNELGYTVHNYEGINQVRLANPNSDVTLHVLAACIGASMKPLQLLSADLMKGEKQQSLLIPFVIMIACFVVAIALFLIGQIRVTTKENEIKKIEEYLTENQYLSSLQKAYESMDDLQDETMKYNNMEVNNNKNFLAFIKELEENMPLQMNIAELKSDDEIIEMTILCRHKDDAATMIQRLYDNFETVRISEVSEVVEFEPTATPEPTLFPWETPTVTPFPWEVTPTPVVTPERLLSFGIKATFRNPVSEVPTSPSPAAGN